MLLRKSAAGTATFAVGAGDGDGSRQEPAAWESDTPARLTTRAVRVPVTIDRRPRISDCMVRARLQSVPLCSRSRDTRRRVSRREGNRPAPRAKAASRSRGVEQARTTLLTQ